MAGISHDYDKIRKATIDGLTEVFGEGSPTVDILTGRILGRLMLDGTSVETPPAPEMPDFSQPPRYAERALGVKSPQELADLITEATLRLDRSLPDYHRHENSRSSGSTFLTPWVLKEGARSGEDGTIIGKLRIFTGNSPSWSDTTIASLELNGGEGSPYDDLGTKDSSYFVRSLSVKQKMVHDPISQTDVPVSFIETTAGYEGSGFQGNNGLLHEDAGGNSLGAYSSIIKADLFWALDMAITYYENVYIAGVKHPGLTYADYRNAGCLGDDGMLDNKKADAYIRSFMAEGDKDWPTLREWDTTVLSMDPDSRAKIQRYKELAMHTVRVTHPHLVHAR